MTERENPRLTAFAGARLIARGSLEDVARVAHAHAGERLLIFEDATGQPVEIDLRGSVDDALPRLRPTPAPPSKPVRGRPKLGVIAREVTLLPRHWDWLATQPGGASAALRRLVEQARRDSVDADVARGAQEAAYRVMTVLAGDLPNYEDAIRALFASDQKRFTAIVSAWPGDIGGYVIGLARPSDA